MTTTTMSVRLGSDEKELISDYAKTMGMSVSDFVRVAALERIEDDVDLKAWNAAHAEYLANPVSHSNADVMREFGLV
jgi:RHH-type transcriptional regulator, rel operon repressor / antitoxin RelB